MLFVCRCRCSKELSLCLSRRCRGESRSHVASISRPVLVIACDRGNWHLSVRKQTAGGNGGRVLCFLFSATPWRTTYHVMFCMFLFVLRMLYLPLPFLGAEKALLLPF